jgi:hypothetical protein
MLVLVPLLVFVAPSPHCAPVVWAVPLIVVCAHVGAAAAVHGPHAQVGSPFLLRSRNTT